jgi:hypothetical protein
MKDIKGLKGRPGAGSIACEVVFIAICLVSMAICILCKELFFMLVDGFCWALRRLGLILLGLNWIKTKRRFICYLNGL